MKSECGNLGMIESEFKTRAILCDQMDVCCSLVPNIFALPCKMRLLEVPGRIGIPLNVIMLLMNYTFLFSILFEKYFVISR